MAERKTEERTESQQEAVAREQAEVAAELAEHPRDETVEGGRYKVNDRLVDAMGEPIKDAKD
jgi:hypothetical protein